MFKVTNDGPHVLIAVVTLVLAFIFFSWLQSEVTRRKEEMEAMKAAELEALEGPLQRHEISPDDHPLSLRSESVWHQFFQVLFLSFVQNS